MTARPASSTESHREAAATATVTLAEAFRRAVSFGEAGRWGEAETLCVAILGADATCIDALHLLAISHYRRRRYARAVESYDKALALAPDRADPWANRAAALIELGRLGEALESCDGALAIASGHVGALTNRTIVLKRLRRLDEALASCDKAIALAPDHFPALNNRGVILNELKRHEEALASCDHALRLQPDDAETLNNRGIALKALKRYEEGLACYDRALVLAPYYAEAHDNRGNALHALKRFDEALASYDRAIALRPGGAAACADAYNHRGNVLKALRRHDEALASYDRALAIRPDLALAHYNRALLLQEMHRISEALQSYQRALALAPDDADMLSARGSALTHRSRLVEAVASFEQALAIEPEHEYVFGGLADCALRLCDWPLQDRIAGEVRRRAAEGRSIISPLTLIGYSDDEALHLACARRYAARKIADAPAPLVTDRARSLVGTGRRARIKVAYLSPDFREHPVGRLAVELIERHDRTQFEVIGVSFGPDDGSALRSRLAAAFDRFHDVSRENDRDVAAMLAHLGTDIVVDLAGYTHSHRAEIFVQRPVPIAVSYLGYAATMGAGFIDYIISDRFVLPFDRQPFYSERIVQLPHCYMVSDTSRAIGEAPTRSAAGLRDGVVFCAFNNHAKIAEPVFDLWMRLLRRIEGSVLWLSAAADAVADNLRRAASARGVDPARLVFAPRLDSFEDHLARHRLADIFLDTLPYNAHTTANDALWAGLPVITCRGNCFAGRVAASQLDAIGLPELATASLGEYEALALRLAADPAQIVQLKARLAGNRLDHPLFDTVRFTRHIEAAYRTMWETWQRGEPPRSFAVMPDADH